MIRLIKQNSRLFFMSVFIPFFVILCGISPTILTAEGESFGDIPVPRLILSVAGYFAVGCVQANSQKSPKKNFSAERVRACFTAVFMSCGLTLASYFIFDGIAMAGLSAAGCADYLSLGSFFIMAFYFQLIFRAVELFLVFRFGKGKLNPVVSAILRALAVIVIYAAFGGGEEIADTLSLSNIADSLLYIRAIAPTAAVVMYGSAYRLSCGGKEAGSHE